MARIRLALLLAAALTLTGAASASAARVWFTSGEQFRTVKRTAASPDAAVRALLRGPTKAEGRTNVETQIPPGTTLSKITVAGGTADIAVSSRFLQGVPRDAAKRNEAQRTTLLARVGQVLFTATQFKGVGKIKLTAGGHVLTTGLARSAYGKPSMPPLTGTFDRGKAEPGTKKLQQQLAALGYLPGNAVDGLYGYRTTQAVMAFQAWEGLTRDGVAGPQTKAALAKASRPEPFGSGPSKRVEVDRARGVALLIRKNRVVRAIHVSSGAGANATPPGTYKIFRKELRSWSVPFQVWLPYASYFNNGIAFHEYPDVPAYPASHGCVRVPAPEAPVVYEFAAIGTTVIVR
jgi:lipoprotein-anchoring transpeptidase ErfK/SrfK